MFSKHRNAVETSEFLRKEVTVLQLLAGLLRKTRDGSSALISIMIKNCRGDRSSLSEFCQIAKEIFTLLPEPLGLASSSLLP